PTAAVAAALISFRREISLDMVASPQPRLMLMPVLGCRSFARWQIGAVGQRQKIAAYRAQAGDCATRLRSLPVPRSALRTPGAFAARRRHCFRLTRKFLRSA